MSERNENQTAGEIEIVRKLFQGVIPFDGVGFDINYKDEIYFFLDTLNKIPLEEFKKKHGIKAVKCEERIVELSKEEYDRERRFEESKKEYRRKYGEQDLDLCSEVEGESKISSSINSNLREETDSSGQKKYFEKRLVEAGLEDEMGYDSKSLFSKRLQPLVILTEPLFPGENKKKAQRVLEIAEEITLDFLALKGLKDIVPLRVAGLEGGVQQFLGEEVQFCIDKTFDSERSSNAVGPLKGQIRVDRLSHLIENHPEVALVLRNYDLYAHHPTIGYYNYLIGYGDMPVVISVVRYNHKESLIREGLYHELGGHFALGIGDHDNQTGTTKEVQKKYWDYDFCIGMQPWRVPLDLEYSARYREERLLCNGCRERYVEGYQPYLEPEAAPIVERLKNHDPLAMEALNRGLLPRIQTRKVDIHN